MHAAPRQIAPAFLEVSLVLTTTAEKKEQKATEKLDKSNQGQNAQSLAGRLCYAKRSWAEILANHGVEVARYSVADISHGVLRPSVRRRAALRRQSVGVGVPTVRLDDSDPRRNSVYRVPGPEPHPTLLQLSRERQLLREARGGDEISHRHHLQRESSLFVENVIEWYIAISATVSK